MSVDGLKRTSHDCSKNCSKTTTRSGKCKKLVRRAKRGYAWRRLPNAFHAPSKTFLIRENAPFALQQSTPGVLLCQSGRRFATNRESLARHRESARCNFIVFIFHCAESTQDRSIASMLPANFQIALRKKSIVHFRDFDQLVSSLP